jgi:CRP/FNR family cyclic AMP-dependent transcriptional regulator
MFADSSFLGRLDGQARDALVRQGHVRWYGVGEFLLREAEPGDRVLLLDVGRVKIVRSSASGTQVVLAVRSPGELLGEIAVLGGMGRSASVVALEHVRVRQLSREQFLGFLRDHPNVYQVLMTIEVNRLQQSETHRLEYRALSVTARLAALLLRLCDEQGERTAAGTYRVPRLSQEDLAAYVAASERAVGEAMRELRSNGVGVRRSKDGLIISGVEVLSALANT